MSRSEHSKNHVSGRKLSQISKCKLRIKGIEHRTNSKLTIQNVKEIRAMNGKSLSEIASIYNVDRGYIYQIKEEKHIIG